MNQFKWIAIWFAKCCHRTHKDRIFFSRYRCTQLAYSQKEQSCSSSKLQWTINFDVSWIMRDTCLCNWSMWKSFIEKNMLESTRFRIVSGFAYHRGMCSRVGIFQSVLRHKNIQFEWITSMHITTIILTCVCIKKCIHISLLNGC